MAAMTLGIEPHSSSLKRIADTVMPIDIPSSATIVLVPIRVLR